MLHQRIDGTLSRGIGRQRTDHGVGGERLCKTMLLPSCRTGRSLDILVANASIAKDATIEKTSVEDFDRLFAVNVRSPFFLVQQKAITGFAARS